MIDFDIWCRDDKCPVCNSKMVKLNNSATGCKNKCYTIVVDWEEVTIHVFSDQWLFTTREYESGHNKQEDVILKIESEIRLRAAYWKKDEKYLMKLMEV